MNNQCRCSTEASQKGTLKVSLQPAIQPNTKYKLINTLWLFQVELERLNAATDDINKLEVDLDVSRPTQVRGPS